MNQPIREFPNILCRVKSKTIKRTLYNSTFKNLGVEKRSGTQTPCCDWIWPLITGICELHHQRKSGWHSVWDIVLLHKQENLGIILSPQQEHRHSLGVTSKGKGQFTSQEVMTSHICKAYSYFCYYLI